MSELEQLNAKDKAKLMRFFASLRADRWYHFQIFPQESGETQYDFIGKVAAKDDTEEALVLRTQDGWLCYTQIFDEIDREEDSVSIRAEWVESGDTVEDILADLKEICGEGFRPPRILTELKLWRYDA
jgi:hypothetical protein